MKEVGKRTKEKEKGEGGGAFVSEDKRLFLDREEAGQEHRQTAVYKGKRGSLVVKDECFILTGLALDFNPLTAGP